MEEEIKNLIKVYFSTIVSLTYCFFICTRIPKGLPRLLSLLPIFYLFSTLPWAFSSVHLRGISAFFLTWLANFKLLLFSFNHGPLVPHRTSFLHFTSTASLPIKPKAPDSPPAEPHHVGLISTSLRGLLLALLVYCYRFKRQLPELVVLALYSFHIYLALEVVLAMARAAALALLGAELEPQFNEPYLASSLQDFWGRRWNLMVTSILRPTVYEPVQRICTHVAGRRWARLLGVWATFLVSGIMHEVLFLYITCAGPTWEVTWFFVLHGFCTCAEVWLKAAVTDTWRFPRVVSGLLTLGFVAVTGFWLFFPQIVRSGTDVKVIDEYSALVRFFVDMGETLRPTVLFG